MADVTWSSIQGIWTQWMDALVAHPRMQGWCGHESDIDLIDLWCRQAGRAGVVSPEVVYGVGGKIATALIEAGLRNRIMERLMIGGGAREAWVANGENDVLIVIDEAGGLLSPGHKDFVTASRSLGGHMLMAVQDDGQLDVSLGSKDDADTVRNNCHMRVTFKTDAKSAEESCAVAGTRERWFPDDKSVAHAPLLELTRMEMASGLKDASRNRLVNLAGGMSGAIARRKHMLQTNHRSQADMDASNPGRAVATLRGTTRHTTTIEESELQTEWEVPGVALVSYYRAKVRRAGVCHMAADYEMASASKQKPNQVVDVVEKSAN